MEARRARLLALLAGHGASLLLVAQQASTLEESGRFLATPLACAALLGLYCSYRALMMLDDTAGQTIRYRDSKTFEVFALIGMFFVAALWVSFTLPLIETLTNAIAAISDAIRPVAKAHSR